ncbi:MAG: NADP-dependent malic enzyme [Candidatus Micrarchaeota archaeon]|nr:NADP-dependent malic enzyme [Candidatus Micrarchaeota archaeon]MDE1848297.1 NADP-dependent malic enzyme [Candidatus Micrarchaeota archaeon]MDE1864750.1 NADP-dependent malic enzyme [Candidatus Micrarchaeota archaeon]
MVDKEKVLDKSRRSRGKMEIASKVPLKTQEDLSTYYTPGVAYPCLEIKADKAKVYDYTFKSNTIAIVTDGTRILGLGDIGPEAGLPVMEGKAILFKRFGGVDAIPLAINTKDEGEIIKFIQQIEPTFGGINIEDIASPKSFHVVDRLTETLDIPVFHDDQQGTATVILAALINAMKLTGKRLKDVKIVIEGTGSAGVGAIRLLNSIGVKRIYSLDSKGAIYEGRSDLNDVKEEISKMVNPEKKPGTLQDLVVGADVLIGLSGSGKFDRTLISKMNEKPIVFALSNPIPEIGYEEAKAAGAFIIGTGSSALPNQINNLLAFPGIMRGLLDSRARKVNYQILQAAANAIAKGVGGKLSADYIVPSMVDQKIAVKLAANVASAVAIAASKSGVARINLDPKGVKKDTIRLIKRAIKAEKKLTS